MDSIKIDLGGKERTLKFDLGVMAEYEDLTGVNALMDNIFENLTSKKLQSMLFCVLKVDEPDITPVDCGKMVNAENMKGLIKSLGDAFMLGRPKSEGKKKV